MSLNADRLEQAKQLAQLDGIFSQRANVSALSAQFESASSPPDPALEFLENVEAKVETEPREELLGGDELSWLHAFQTTSIP